MTLTLTETAATEVKKFLEAENLGNDGGLRLRVVPGGCSGFQYGMNIEEAPQATDEVVEASGLRVLRQLVGQLDFYASHVKPL